MPHQKIFFCLAALACGALFFAQAHADNIAGQVIGITDGDTLMLQDTQQQQHPIRIAGIDAPELAQDFGQPARASLSLLALNQHAVADCQKPNPNQIKICAVTISGKDIGAAQISNGMASWYHQNAAALSVQTQTDYRQAEFNAKIHRLGLWNSKNPSPPWVWHRGRGDD